MTRDEADESVRETPFGEFVRAVYALPSEEENEVKKIARAFMQMTAKENPRHTAAAMVFLTHLMLVEIKRCETAWICW